MSNMRFLLGLVIPIILTATAPRAFASGCDKSDLLPIRHPWISTSPDGLLLRVILQLNDQQISFGGIETSADSQRLRIHLTERNNDLLISFLASSLGISEGQIEIQSGPKNVKKVLLLKLKENEAEAASQILNSKI